MQITIPSHLSDAELVAEVKRFALCERKATVSLVAHLAELDARRLHLAAGFPSLFAYCRAVLALSEHEAYLRIEAARTARRFPAVLRLLAEGAANLTTIKLLAPVLTPENHAERLAAASRLSKREVEELVARWCPRPDVPFAARKVHEPTPSVPVRAAPGAASDVAAAEPAILGPLQGPDPVTSPLIPPVPIAASSGQRRKPVTPLSEDRYEVRFTATATTLDKLRLAQDLLRHAVPDGDMARIVDRALTALLVDLARKKFAATDRPRRRGDTRPGSRHVRAGVKRAVWLRDSGRCAFVAKGGRRCATRGFLEFHHRKPYGAGGEATVENLELRCRAHNAYDAELFYGRPGTGGGEGLLRDSAVAYDGPASRSARSGPSWPATRV
jgi:hypothetical protein